MHSALYATARLLHEWIRRNRLEFG